MADEGRFLRPPDDELALGGCPYPLLGVLGRGGQGDVHASRDPVGGAPLAVKVLHRGASRTARAALVREYQVLRELDHPAIPDVHGFGQLRDGRAWLATEYIEGRQSHDWARTLGPAGSPERCLAVLTMIAAAADTLGYLHSLGVVHGDMKPANLLVKPDGTPYVVDLGGASLELGPDHYGHGFYRTAVYAPAEQDEKQRLLPSADVYALAATAVRLMTDRYPFGAGTRAEVRARQDAGPPELDVPPDHIPEAARALLLRSLAFEPGTRPADGHAFANALREALGADGANDEGEASATEAPLSPPDGRVGEVLRALALASALGTDGVALATLCSGLGARAGDIRRALDGLEAAGWVRRSAVGQWIMAARAIPVASALIDPASPAHVALAARLADEWEGDPSSPGRAYCLHIAGRDAVAADHAVRWARRALVSAGVRETLVCGRVLDALGALDTRLTGAARTSWLLMRAHVAILVNLGDTRADTWLADMETGALIDAERAASLRHAVALWRGAPSLRQRPLAVAAAELASDRFDSAFALARTEVAIHTESGALDLAAEAAFIAGEALVALGRLEEGARALADALAWWPGREGRGQVAVARASALGALGRWGEAAELLQRVRRDALTPWDRDAATIGLAAISTDCGHPRRARAWLAAIVPMSLASNRRLHTALTAETLRAEALAGTASRALAESAEALVTRLFTAGSRADAARISTWQAAVIWADVDADEALALVEAATEVLAETGHRLWWAEADALHRWLANAGSPSARRKATEAFGAFVERATAWPLAMRSALAEGDVATAWVMATRFLAHLDPAQAAALELSPWAARARRAERSLAGAR